MPFYSGAMHYWRVEPAHWAACLKAIHALGLTMVETYVPWRVHEPERGVFDWSGARDLARFLDAARAAGLSVVVRPGPHVNAELTSFGIPDWVLAEPACQARTARGTPAWLPVPPRAFPIPSYASKAFQAHVRAWYGAVADIVKPHLAPDGPVVAIGVDNEAQMFFRSGAYDHDYHPDAIAGWRSASGLEGEPPRAWDAGDAARCISWVRFKDQYIAHALAWGAETGAGDAPRAWDPANAATCVQWVLFKDEYIARALGDFAAMLDDVGLGELARFHNLPPGHHGLYDLRWIQSRLGGPVGIDAYTPRAQFSELRRRALALVGDARPIPIAFEVGIGFFPWFPPLDATDDPTRERDHLLTLLAAGVRGFNLFMAVERDRYYGAAISSTGVLESHASWIKPLLATLAEVDWPGLRRATPIAVMNTRVDERFGQATCVIDPMTPVLADALGLGPGGATELGTDKAAIESRKWQLAVCHALELAQVPYVIVDEAALADELATYRAVIAPTLDRIDQTPAEQLRLLAEQKRAIIVIGPGTPTRDEFDQPIDFAPKRIGRLKAGSLDDLAGLADDLAQLAGDVSEAWQVERPDQLRTSVFANGERARVVFVTSDSDRPATAVMFAGEGATSLRDGVTGDLVKIADGRFTIAMHPRGVRMFVIS